MRLPWVREGVLFISISVLAMLIGLWLTIHQPKNIGLKILVFGITSIGFLLLITSLIFFRDPERQPNASRNEILAPADGRVVAVETLKECRYLQGPSQRIAVFMHIGNVHVQRIPYAGELVATQHKPGRFYPAFLPKAAEENERRWYIFETNEKRKYAIVQIAGMIARRTVSWLNLNKKYNQGERLGMIMFGSEVDTYLPVDVTVKIKPGERVYAGKTIIGVWKE